MLALFFFGDFYLLIPCWHFLFFLLFYLGSFSYTSRAGFFFLFCLWGVCLTHPVLALIWGVSIIHPMLAFFFFFFFFKSGEFLLHIPCWLYFSVGSFSYTSLAGFFYMNFFLPHHMLALFLPGNLSYKSRADFTFLWGLSLTHPVLASLLFYLFFIWGVAGIIFIGGVSLTHPMLPLFLFGEFLLHTPCWLLFLFFSFFASGEFLLHTPC